MLPPFLLGRGCPETMTIVSGGEESLDGKNRFFDHQNRLKPLCKGFSVDRFICQMTSTKKSPCKPKLSNELASKTSLRNYRHCSYQQNTSTWTPKWI